MLRLKCTGEVQKAMGLRKAQLVKPLASDSLLGDWYVHRFSAAGTVLYLFMSETTLLSFVLYQGRQGVSAERLPLMFLAGLEQLLNMLGASTDQVSRVMHDSTSGLFAKTDSRKTLGCLNDLVRCYGHAIEHHGRLGACDLSQIIAQINRMPQRTLDWRDAWAATEAALRRPGPFAAHTS